MITTVSVCTYVCLLGTGAPLASRSER